MRLKGKNAVITGAASGVGRASSLLFAREGASIACVDIDAAMGEETAAMVRKEGGEAIFIETDLADPAAIERMAAQLLQPVRQNPGQSDPSGGNAQQNQLAAVGHALQHLGGQTVERAAQLSGREDLNALGGHGRSDGT